MWLLFLASDDEEEDDEWALDESRPVFVYKPILKKNANRRKVREHEMLVRIEQRLNESRAAAIAEEKEGNRKRLELARCVDLLVPLNLP